MKLIFAGTPQFAAVALDCLIASGFEVKLVLTQPDRPSGRGLHAIHSAVKLRATAHQLPLAQPASLKLPEIPGMLRGVGADAIVVAAYGLLLPVAVLAIPPRGCINIHASLLPRWRGAAPIQRALLAGDSETGVTIMQMNEGLDTGDILLQESISIAADDTTQTLHDKLAQRGAHDVVQVLRENPAPRAQDGALATYAEKISKAEAVIDWSRSAAEICRQVRAFNPAPGAATAWNGTPLKIWRAEPVAHVSIVPGTVVGADTNGVIVAAGEGAVRVVELQRAGAKRLAAGAFISGSALAAGALLGS